jgi:hypothetical protein
LKLKRRPRTEEPLDLAPTSPADIERMQAEILHWRRRAAQSEAELLELQKIDTLHSIHGQRREMEIQYYLKEIESLNLTIPGGLRCQPVAQDGEDQELVNEAWWRFCGRRSGGHGRF